MVSPYWQHILAKPTGVGLMLICLLSLPVLFWEIGQWRLAYLTKPLPWWVTPRVLAPFLLATLIFLFAVFAFASSMTHVRQNFAINSGVYYVSEALLASALAVSLPRILVYFLKSPYALPSGGTYTDSHVPWTVEASGYDGISRHD